MKTVYEKHENSQRRFGDLSANDTFMRGGSTDHEVHVVFFADMGLAAFNMSRLEVVSIPSDETVTQVWCKLVVTQWCPNDGFGTAIKRIAQFPQPPEYRREDHATDCNCEGCRDDRRKA